LEQFGILFLTTMSLYVLKGLSLHIYHYQNFVHDVVNFEAIHDQILFELKLGRQASGYKAVQKALNRFIQEIRLVVDSF
jgi:hypothetical protein